jgi:hypothetical protein
MRGRYWRFFVRFYCLQKIGQIQEEKNTHLIDDHNVHSQSIVENDTWRCVENN